MPRKGRAGAAKKHSKASLEMTSGKQKDVDKKFEEAIEASVKGEKHAFMEECDRAVEDGDKESIDVLQKIIDAGHGQMLLSVMALTAAEEGDTESVKGYMALQKVLKKYKI